MATVVGSQLEVIKEDVLRMMGYAGLSIDEAVRSLDDRDEDAANRVIDRDRQIDDLQKKIEIECLEMLTKSRRTKTFGWSRRRTSS